MSIVACRVEKSTIQIAADSIVVLGTTKQQLSKLEKFSNGLVIGGTGTAEETALMFLFAETHAVPSEGTRGILEFINEFAGWKQAKIGDWSIGNSYIFVYKGTAYLISNFFVTEIKEYNAVGAGMDFALAALLLGKDAKEAVEVACKLSCYCNLPVEHYEIPRDFTIQSSYI